MGGLHVMADSPAPQADPDATVISGECWEKKPT